MASRDDGHEADQRSERQDRAGLVLATLILVAARKLVLVLGTAIAIPPSR